MQNRDISIGSILMHKEFGQVVVAKIFQGYIYAHLADGSSIGMLTLDEVEPIEISEEYLLDFGFTKAVSSYDLADEIVYELETKDAFFVYADCWSLSIADSRKSYEDTPNYIIPDTELINKVHLWQNIFKSLTGKDSYEREWQLKSK